MLIVVTALVVAGCGSVDGDGDPFRSAPISAPDLLPDPGEAPTDGFGTAPPPVMVAASDITEDPVAVVDGTEISAERVRLEVEALLDNDVFFDQIAITAPDEFDRENVAVSQGVLSQIIGRHIIFTLIENEVAARGIELTGEAREAADDLAADFVGSQELLDGFNGEYRDLLLAWNSAQVALAQDISGVPPAIDDAAIAAYFDENRESLAQFCSRHILVETEEEAADVISRLDDGEPFGEVAQDVSIDPGSGAQGGDLGCVSRGQFVAEFEEAAFSQELGVVGDPVQSQFGFHIIVVDDRPEPTLEGNEDQLRFEMEQARDQAINEFLQTALLSSEVTVDPVYGEWNPLSGQVDPPPAG